MKNTIEEKKEVSVVPRIDFVKTHPDAKLPNAHHPDPQTSDTGHDLYAVEDVVVRSKSSAIVPVGLKVAYITPGWWFRIEARSGLSFKYGIVPHFGVVDNGYRGDCGVLLYNFGEYDVHIHKGDKIAQIVVYPLYRAAMSFVDEIQESERGDKGFGSSDE